MEFYSKYKKNFQFENYLDNLNWENRKIISRFRLSNHEFPIENLRFAQNILREHRICTICDLNDIGDENHYPLKCNNNKINEIRNNFNKSIKDVMPQMSQFSMKNIIDYCMTMSDVTIYKTTAIFLEDLLLTFKIILLLSTFAISCFH